MKKRGRPKLLKGTTQEAVVTVRMSKEERKTIGDAAKMAGSPKLSEWIRETLLEAAEVVKQSPSKPTIAKTAKINSWDYSEDGGTVRIRTPETLPRSLWERLQKYVNMLEPLD